MPFDAKETLMQRPIRALCFVAALVLTALQPRAAAAGVLTENCVVGDRPAATLLFPYFEVDLANPAGRTTLISINNVNTVFVPILARFTLWTDWGIPTLGFNLYLTPNDVLTINMRDLFTDGGVVPTTGPGAAAFFFGCNDTIGGFSTQPLLLRPAHTGQNTLGSCFSSGSLGPNVATGYVTVDTSLACPIPSGGGSDAPDDPDYFTAAHPVGATYNSLWGDWMLVTPGEAFASGNPAVHLVADTDFFGAGDYTFYGRYHGFDGVDSRTPLPSRYDARFLNGGAFTGGTKLIVWRDNRNPSTGVVACGSSPAWVPIGERQIVAHDELAHSTNLGSTSIFDLATQRMDITAVPQPYTFGFLEMNLNTPANTPAQAWVGVEASAAGKFSVGFTASPTNDLCAVVP